MCRGVCSSPLPSRVGWLSPLRTRKWQGPHFLRAAHGCQEMGLSSCLTLYFSSGSECATSCLDHNSESIILPVNVTVRDIPHWLNPMRVEVSDRGCPLAAMGREMTMVNIYCALVLH